MSIQPAIGLGSSSTPQGIASIVADIRRRIAQVEAARTVIGPDSINGGQIQNGTISATNLVVGTITTDYIAAGAITTNLLAAQAVVADRIAAGAITAVAIQAGAITAAAIQAGAITTAKLDAGSVTADKIAAGAVTSDKITVTNLSALTSNLGNITAGLITGATVQTSSSGAGRVVMDSAGLRAYALDGVTKTFELNAGSGIATFTGIAYLDPSSVIPSSAFTIADGSITTTKVADDAISTPKLQANSVSTLQVQAGAITANQIATGAVTAGKILVEFNGPNQLKNSGFEYNQYSTAGQNWSAGATTTFTVITTDAYEGARSASVVSTVANGTITLNYTGTLLVPFLTSKYSFSAWVKASAAGTIGKTIDIFIDWKNSSNATISSTHLTTPQALTSTWARVFVTATPPAGTVSAALRVVGTLMPSGSGMLVDAVQFERGDFVTNYGVGTADVEPGSLGPTVITPNSITTNQITSAGINGDRITASTIDSTRINVASLSAISANLGVVTAGTVTGATIQNTSTPIAGGVILDATGMRAYGPKLATAGAMSGATVVTTAAASTFVAGNQVVYKYAVSNSQGMSDASPASAAATIATTNNQYVQIPLPIIDGATSLRIWRSINNGVTYTAFMDLGEAFWGSGTTFIQDYGATIFQGLATWTTTGSPFTPTTTNNAFNKFFDASTTGGTISGGIIRTSDQISRLQLDHTNGLRVLDSNGVSQFQLARSANMSWSIVDGGISSISFNQRTDTNPLQNARLYIQAKGSGGASIFSNAGTSQLATLEIGTGTTYGASGIGSSNYLQFRTNKSAESDPTAHGIIVKANYNNNSGPPVTSWPYFSKWLLRADGYSDWVQGSEGSPSMRLARGSGNYFFGAGSGRFSSGAAIPHGLGVNPASVQVGLGMQTFQTVGIYAWDAAYFYIQVANTDGVTFGGGSLNVYWMAST